MTKLEEKLIELGYEEQPKHAHNQRVVLYFKNIYDYSLAIYYDCKSNKIIDEVVFTNAKIIRTQQDIDNLQLAFNELQRDLEVLKEYEKERRF